MGNRKIIFLGYYPSCIFVFLAIMSLSLGSWLPCKNGTHFSAPKLHSRQKLQGFEAKSLSNLILCQVLLTCFKHRLKPEQELDPCSQEVTKTQKQKINKYREIQGDNETLGCVIQVKHYKQFLMSGVAEFCFLER